MWHITGACTQSPECAGIFLFAILCTLPQVGENKSLRRFHLETQDSWRFGILPQGFSNPYFSFHYNVFSDVVLHYFCFLFKKEEKKQQKRECSDFVSLRMSAVRVGKSQHPPLESRRGYLSFGNKSC